MNQDDQGVMARKVPSHEQTYNRLRDMVLFGLLEPGQPVTIQGLIRDLDAGMTPVREAIRRLIAEGALVLHDNRRVSVPAMTPDVLDQLTYARLNIEPKLAEMACSRLDVQAINQMEQVDHLVDDALERREVQAYLTRNHQFHFMLYEAAGALVLEDMARSLWLRFGPALRLVMPRYIQADFPDCHIEILAALRAKDVQALRSALSEDIVQGADLVRQSI